VLALPEDGVTMSDLGHSPENRNRIIELIDAIMAARSPAKD
jgi:hypothetical protein